MNRTDSTENHWAAFNTELGRFPSSSASKEYAQRLAGLAIQALRATGFNSLNSTEVKELESVSAKLNEDPSASKIGEVVGKLLALSSKKERLTAEEFALVERINTEKLSLANPHLPRMDLDQLNKIAPFLTHVDVRGEPFNSLSHEELFKFIQNCSSLNTLFINSNKIQALPPLPLCAHLDCSRCPQLQALPQLPLCARLDCSGCPLLQALPPLPLCAHLVCHRCPLLQALPPLPLCAHLDCSYCPLLQALPALPLCARLVCHMCPQLQALPQLPLCARLDCSGCPLLQALPPLPVCTDLNCSRCPLLAALPPLLACTTLDCSECPLLQGIPELPARATIYSSLNSARLSIALSKLENNPEGVLDQLKEWFSRNRHFPNIVFLNPDGSPNVGVDIGGLRRHLVSTLFTHLLSKNPRREGSTPLSLFSLRGDFPVQRSEEDAARWETVGKLFAFAYRDQLLTGIHFDPNLFSALFVLLNPTEAPPAEEEALKRWKVDRHLKVFFKLSDSYAFAEKALRGERLSEEDGERYEFLLKDLQNQLDPEKKGIDLLGATTTKETIGSVILDSIRAGVLSNTVPYRAMIDASESIARGMESVPGLTRASSAQELQESIEGKLNKEIVKESLRIEAFPQGVQSPTFLQAWIDRTSDKELVDFVKAVTGSTSLLPGSTKLNITYDSYHENGLPTAQTCFYLLKLPNYTGARANQESFNERMNEFLANATGFTMA